MHICNASEKYSISISVKDTLPYIYHHFVYSLMVKVLN